MPIVKRLDHVLRAFMTYREQIRGYTDYQVRAREIGDQNRVIETPFAKSDQTKTNDP